jgi:hypothetical protein
MPDIKCGESSWIWIIIIILLVLFLFPGIFVLNKPETTV